VRRVSTLKDAVPAVGLAVSAIPLCQYALQVNKRTEANRPFTIMIQRCSEIIYINATSTR
jgi:hypothetical protein